ncbi:MULTISPECIES: hypothetical protein [Methanosarcina]|uniref:DUF420 domain-containing protein n=1 Tax=Methanosarcina barkeri CM1 TaxID=796385 RepID=A0A0G3CE78_METBA|nr:MULTISPECIES: hypothetical protein [Methanosarcina]AKJ37422.1 hypothetical protein MCM1_0309 [Methanosarcina barkeri CM1]OEC91246.1 hypothetical protein A9239_03330 [Methanosarcina sp. A14]
MSGIDSDSFMLISFDLQKIALILIIIGFIIVRVGKLSKGNLNRHDMISAFGYLLVVLSVPYMINFTYDTIVSQTVTPVILIHSLIGIVILLLGFIVVINRRSWKIKRRWKTKVNMQILLVLWLVNFILGTYMALFT